MSNPLVTLDWDLWCARHLEPLRAEWPRGAALAQLGLFHAAVAHPRVGDLAGGDAKKLTEALRSLAPLCCLVGDELAKHIVAEALAGRVYGKGPAA